MHQVVEDQDAVETFFAKRLKHLLGHVGVVYVVGLSDGYLAL